MRASVDTTLDAAMVRASVVDQIRLAYDAGIVIEYLPPLVAATPATPNSRAAMTVEVS
jgi:hypothetical protein